MSTQYFISLVDRVQLYTIIISVFQNTFYHIANLIYKGICTRMLSEKKKRFFNSGYYNICIIKWQYPVIPRDRPLTFVCVYSTVHILVNSVYNINIIVNIINKQYTARSYRKLRPVIFPSGRNCCKSNDYNNSYENYNLINYKLMVANSVINRELK